MRAKQAVFTHAPERSSIQKSDSEIICIRIGILLSIIPAIHQHNHLNKSFTSSLDINDPEGNTRNTTNHLLQEVSDMALIERICQNIQCPQFARINRFVDSITMCPFCGTPYTQEAEDGEAFWQRLCDDQSLWYWEAFDTNGFTMHAAGASRIASCWKSRIPWRLSSSSNPLSAAPMRITHLCPPLRIRSPAA